MLIDVQTDGNVNGRGVILAIIAKGNSGSEQIDKGFYQIKHFSFNFICTTPIKEEWPEIEGVESAYGVCDSPYQFKMRYGNNLEFSSRKFCVSFTEIVKSEQPSEGGWRWHKWGPYVGVGEPTTEYLYDEPHSSISSRFLTY